MESRRGRAAVYVALVVALMLAGAAAWAAHAGADKSAPHRPRMGVLDIGRVFQNYKKRATLQAEFLRINESLAVQQQHYQSRVIKLKAEIEQFARGTTDRLSREEALGKAQKELRSFVTVARKTMNEKSLTMTMEVYRDIMSETARYAEEKGFDLILKHQALSEELRSAPDLRLHIGQRAVLYHASRLDVSEAVLLRLNERYDASVEAGRKK